MPDVLTVITMLILITLIHEIAHAITAIWLGYKLKKIYLGIPISQGIKGKTYTTTLWKKEIRGIEYGISWLILGGAVDFYDFDNVPAWKFSLIGLAGPISNLLMAFVSIWLVAGFESALTVTKLLTETVLQGLGLIATGQAGINQLTGPVGFVTAMSTVAASYSMGWLLVWNIINVALFVTNMLPIPALDGGQILLSWVGQILGEKSKAPIRQLTVGTLYVLCALMVLIMAKDIVSGLTSFLK